ncbi:UNVERIFIED_CONTAM: hypothetical protein RMT77_017748 [Armadillidium vulgare]
MQTPYSMMPMRGGFYGRFPMRGMMRRSWRQFPMGNERDFFFNPYEFGPHPCRGHGHRRKHKAHHRRKNKEEKRKSGGEGKEDEIVIDGSSDESPDAEWENTVPDAFEVQVNLRGCDTDNIKISIKDGHLKVEGSNKSTDTNFISVTHEQNIPEKVSTDNLKAFLHPEGLLTISEMEETYFPFQLTVERK